MPFHGDGASTSNVRDRSIVHKCLNTALFPANRSTYNTRYYYTLLTLWTAGPAVAANWIWFHSMTQFNQQIRYAYATRAAESEGTNGRTTPQTGRPKPSRSVRGRETHMSALRQKVLPIQSERGCCCFEICFRSVDVNAGGWNGTGCSAATSGGGGEAGGGQQGD